MLRFVYHFLDGWINEFLPRRKKKASSLPKNQLPLRKWRDLLSNHDDIVGFTCQWHNMISTYRGKDTMK